MRDSVFMDEAPAKTDAVGDFVKQIDKTLRTRRLYASNTITYKESNDRLFELLCTAVDSGGFKLRVTSNGLYIGKHSIVTFEERSDSFFFPLFRDGLRELSFSYGVSPDQLERLLEVFEIERSGKLSPSTDTVSMMWRADLDAISFIAIDGISDEEGDPDAPESAERDDYSYLISEVMSQIRDPAPSLTGQSYDFVLDADIKITASDMHYEATTLHRSFEDNITIMNLSQTEVDELREEIVSQDESELLGRFVEILFVLLSDPARPVSMASLAPIFERLLQGYWASQDYSALVIGLQRLHSARQEAPNPENRTAAGDILRSFFNQEMLDESFERVITKELSTSFAFAFWSFAGDAIWSETLAFWASLTVDDLKKPIEGFLRKKLSANPDLMRPSLLNGNVVFVRAALALLPERAEHLFPSELLALTRHDDESIRLKGLAAAGRLGGADASATLWRVIENDPAKSVRLLAFRLVASSEDPKIAQKIQMIVSSQDFHERPVWEREKYVKLIATVDPAAAIRIFDRWIPREKWIWNQQDREMAQLAVSGIFAAGPQGREKVSAIEAKGGKIAKITRSILADVGTQDS